MAWSRSNAAIGGQGATMWLRLKRSNAPLLKMGVPMKWIVSSVIMLALLAVPARAGCLFVSGPCSEDSSGNIYTTEPGLGGGYVTKKNGSFDSSTGQTVGDGGYREDYENGGSRYYNYDPYERPKGDFSDPTLHESEKEGPPFG